MCCRVQYCATLTLLGPGPGSGWCWCQSYHHITIQLHCHLTCDVCYYIHYTAVPHVSAGIQRAAAMYVYLFYIHHIYTVAT